MCMSPKPIACLLLPLLFAACFPPSRGRTPEPQQPCVPEASPPEAQHAEPDPLVAASEPPTPQPTDLGPGRYWFRNGQCSALDVRVVRRGVVDLMEFAMPVAGGVHSSAGTVFYLAADGAAQRQLELPTCQRTFARFGRLGRRGRLWRAGETQCVAVEAKRDGATLELRYSEAVEGGRTDTTQIYTVSPLELQAWLRSLTTTYSPTGGGPGGAGGASGTGIPIPMYFGDGVVLLGTADLFFERAACEA